MQILLEKDLVIPSTNGLVRIQKGEIVTLVENSGVTQFKYSGKTMSLDLTIDNVTKRVNGSINFRDSLKMKGVSALDMVKPLQKLIDYASEDSSRLQVNSI